MARDPYYSYVYAFQAQIANNAGRPLEAVARASRGLAIDSSQADTYRQLADANLQLGRFGGGASGGPTGPRARGASHRDPGDARARRSLRRGHEPGARRSRFPGRGIAWTAGPLSWWVALFEAGYLSAAYAQLGIADSAVTWAQRIVSWDRRFHWVELERLWLWDPVRTDSAVPGAVAESGREREDWWKVGRLEGSGATSHFPILPTFQLSAQCPDGSPPPCTRPTRTGPTDPYPIAHCALSGDICLADSNDVAIAEGITEEVITRLSQIPGLRVTSRYAALRFRGRRQLDPRLAGRELGVRYVLQGTLRRLRGSGACARGSHGGRNRIQRLGAEL